jgi:zinc transporter, ZIP family
MPDALDTVLTYVAIPVLVIAVGGTLSAFLKFGPRLRSSFQHFAAGLVFAAVSAGLLTEVMKAHELIPTVIGFSIGVVLMLGMKWLLERGGHPGFSEKDPPWSLVATAGVDYVVDGLLIGIVFGIGARAGALLTLALTVEGLFLAIAVTSTLKGHRFPWTRLMLISAAFGLLFGVGAIVGSSVHGFLSGPVHTAMLAFGSAALISLVTEELLVEAHEHRIQENPMMAALFFAGFLLIIVIELSI